jgi:D-alanine-D-alanine ligase
MKIGITYDLKIDGPPQPGLPDDFQEEFDSPATVEGIAQVLRELGHQVEKLGDGRELIERLLADPPDFVFNFAEGQGISRSREARVPAVLEMLGIPYTGSDPLTLAVTLDKDCAKRLVASAGVAVPGGLLVQPGREGGWRTGADGTVSLRELQARVSYPAIVKPAWEGSSKGIRQKCLVETPEDLLPALDSVARDHRQPVLVEEFIEGDELTVGVVGNDPPQVIGIMRVLPKSRTNRFIYSLEVKRDYERRVRYECPAQLSAADTEAVRKATLAAYHILGCRDVARVDFRLRAGVPYFLEVNPLPGLNTVTSDLVILARQSGWTYPQLIGAILRSAIERIH